MIYQSSRKPLFKGDITTVIASACMNRTYNVLIWNNAIQGILSATRRLMCDDLNIKTNVNKECIYKLN